MAERESKLAFLRQSSWLALATGIAGVTSYAVHPFIKDAKAEYGAFTAMLQLLNLIAIPAIGLQAVFTHKAAEAKTDDDHKRLAREQIAIGIVVFALAVVVSEGLSSPGKRALVQVGTYGTLGAIAACTGPIGMAAFGGDQ